MPASLIYHDVHHTGNGPDLFIVETDNGSVRLLRDQLDADHYWEQERAKHINELGAGVGDRVMILKSGSGTFCREFDPNKPNLITDIGSGGHVTFNGGTQAEATIFRPKVSLCEASPDITLENDDLDGSSLSIN